MNYIGSKFSLLDFLQETISQVTGYIDGKGLVFGDLFAGTGVVGSTYKEHGWTVIANDIQYYSFILTKHYIENCPPIRSLRFFLLYMLSSYLVGSILALFFGSVFLSQHYTIRKL